MQKSTVELEPIKNWTRRLEILKNRNLYKENRDPTFSKSRQNLANAAKTHVRKWQLGVEILLRLFTSFIFK